MEKHYSYSLACTVEYLNFVTWLFVNDLTINKLSYTFIYFNTNECSSLITMQDVMHKTTRKSFYGFIYKIGLYPHCCLHVGFHQVYSESITELDWYHVAPSPRPQFKEMHIIVYVKQNLNVHLAKTYV